MYYQADSDAAITKGLIALIIHAYSSFPPEVIIKNPPIFLEKIGLHNLLSPLRSNGLYMMFKRMKREAQKAFELDKLTVRPGGFEPPTF